MSKTIPSADQFIGRRIRDLRTKRRIALTTLAFSLEISHQQLQKYEAGKNAVSASRLACIAHLLKVKIDAFYMDDDGLPPPLPPMQQLDGGIVEAVGPAAGRRIRKTSNSRADG